jgi:hypothetical protein
LPHYCLLANCWQSVEISPSFKPRNGLGPKSGPLTCAPHGPKGSHEISQTQTITNVDSLLGVGGVAKKKNKGINNDQIRFNLTCLYCVHAVRTVKSGMARNTATQVSITYPITNENARSNQETDRCQGKGGVVFTIISIYDPTDIMWYGTAKQASFNYL